MLRMYETSFEIAPGIAIWFGERHRSLAVLGDQRLAREQMVREVPDNPSLEEAEFSHKLSCALI